MSCIFLGKDFVLFSSPSVGPVPGRLVPRHRRTRPNPGGWGMVWGKERRPHPDFPEERLRPGQEPGIQGGQEERFGQQGHQEKGYLDPCQQVCLPNSINRKWFCLFFFSLPCFLECEMNIKLDFSLAFFSFSFWRAAQFRVKPSSVTSLNHNK